jgi:molybdopterin-guanine dinucleotide biosynthesis protein MobB
VSAVKHTHHGFDLDRPGKDSFRFRAAGAGQVLIAGPQRWALMTELHGAEPGLPWLLAELAPCDLVLVEGFRRDGSIPHIEVRASAFALRASADLSASGPEARSAKAEPRPVALVCDDPVDEAVPRFARDDVEAIAAFIVRHLGMA